MVYRVKARGWCILALPFFSTIDKKTYVLFFLLPYQYFLLIVIFTISYHHQIGSGGQSCEI